MAKIDDSVKKKVPELRFKGFTVSATRINKIKKVQPTENRQEKMKN